jgi:hypothetical protein
VLPADHSISDTVELVSERAQGMFLWVRLLMEYLALPALTVRERLEAIKNLNRLEGLDALYDAILNSIKSQFPTYAQQRITRIFQWVIRAQRLLHVDELRTAVAVPYDRAQSPEDLIPNFEKSLGALSGSLIELTPNRFVQLIHFSAQEYFLGKGEHSGGPIQDPRLAAYSQSADRWIAITCLAYLRFTLPPEPLGGSPQVTPNITLIRQKYPLLDYSTRFWSLHLAQSLEESEVSENSLKHLVELVSAFLYDKRRVTVWIEAGWLISSPRIWLPPMYRTSNLTLDALPKALIGQMAEIFRDLRQLSSDLQKLADSWSHVLRPEPNEIWEPSIPAFTRSRFWMDPVHVRLMRMVPRAAGSNTSITVQSQVSGTGSELGIIRLLPPGLVSPQDVVSTYRETC